MKLDRNSTIRDVAAVIAATLEKAGIDAVLTGGACATIHTSGKYQSLDLDFVIVRGEATMTALSAAMKGAGFERKTNEYAHPRCPFIVEFPRGPLAIGSDTRITPIGLRIRHQVVLALSPTDSCRDRLAAFYFWGDRQSLNVAIEIARKHAVDLSVIRKWSAAEDRSTEFAEFHRHLGTGKRTLPLRRRREPS